MPLFGKTFSPKKTPPRKCASLSNLHSVSPGTSRAGWVLPRAPSPFTRAPNRDPLCLRHHFRSPVTIQEGRNGIAQGRIGITPPAVQSCFTKDFSPVISEPGETSVHLGGRKRRQGSERSWSSAPAVGDQSGISGSRVSQTNSFHWNASPKGMGEPGGGFGFL